LIAISFYDCQNCKLCGFSTIILSHTCEPKKKEIVVIIFIFILCQVVNAAMGELHSISIAENHSRICSHSNEKKQAINCSLLMHHCKFSLFSVFVSIAITFAAQRVDSRFISRNKNKSSQFSSRFTFTEAREGDATETM
jgi:lysylphosphatidylglycerol synthetase-like protein (DUF2156 family)